MSRVTLILALAVAAIACAGPETATQGLMLDWAKALNYDLATAHERGNVYAERLEDVMTADMLDRDDAWGTPLAYRRIHTEKYQLISAGPDGEMGNDDDIVVENGLLRKAGEVYAERPWRR